MGALRCLTGLCMPCERVPSTCSPSLGRRPGSRLPFRDTTGRVARQGGGSPVIRSGALAPVLTFLRRLGAPVDRLVERAHLRPDECRDPEALVPLVFANRLLDSAARASGIRDLGLLATREVDPFHLGTYGRLMNRAGTVGRALDTSVRLKPAWNRGAQVRLVRRFTRAFRAWTGASQSDFRRTYRGRQSDRYSGVAKA